MINARPAGAPLRRILPAVATLVVFSVALLALHQVSGELQPQAVLAAYDQIPAPAIAIALGLTLASYLFLTLYDVLALRQVRHPLPYAQVAPVSFIAYAIGHNAGVVALSAGAIRYRMYSLAGLSGTEISQIIVFCTLTFALGAGLLTGVSLIVDAGQATSLLHVRPGVAVAAGSAMLAAVGGYLLLATVRRAPLRVGGWLLPLPSWRLVLAQAAVASADLIVACGALFVLLPADAGITFTTFVALYMVAMVAGVVSSVPGGLGVFDSILVLLLPGVAADQLLGALIAYRLIYYVVPFAAAIGLLCVQQLGRQRARLRPALDWSRRALAAVLPEAMALVAFAAGLILLLSGATPAVAGRLLALQQLLPLPVLEASHLAGSAIGVALLVLARGLYQRLDAAWHLMVWLLAAGIVASLLKGFDYEEAALLLVILLPLLATRHEFYRRASLLDDPLSPGWLAAITMAVMASVWVGLMAHRAVAYQHELWWQFAFDASAPRMLRASLVAVIGLGGLAAWHLLQPARPRAAPPSPQQLGRVREIVRNATNISANLALLGDKALLFSPSGQGFVMYAAAGRSQVAMGDPVGPPGELGELVWQFRDLCDRQGARCVFYEVAAENLPLYVDAGLTLSKLGEEGRVWLPDFSLDGAPRAALRQAHRKAVREGVSFRVAPVAETAQLLPRLRAISDEWLASRAASEKGFSLGYFAEDYLANFPCALVERDGVPVAFANIWESATLEEFSIDLMRHTGAAPKGVMDFLFAEVMLWGRAAGYRWFSLGMAPLAGLEVHRLAPAWHRLGRLLYRHGENFYNFEGLHRFKDKFQPQWRPRYLAAPGGLALPQVLLDVTTLIAGGMRGTLGNRGLPRAHPSRGVSDRSPGTSLHPLPRRR